MTERYWYDNGLSWQGKRRVHMRAACEVAARLKGISVRDGNWHENGDHPPLTATCIGCGERFVVEETLLNRWWRNR